MTKLTRGLFTPDLWERILALISAGETLRDIEGMPGMPSRETILVWARKTPELTAQYTVARTSSSDALEAELLSKARSIRDPAAARVEIDALKWVIARRDPKRYGDKQAIEHSGADGGPIEIKGGGISALLAAANKNGAEEAGSD